MRIVITGATGSVGTSLLLALAGVTRPRRVADAAARSGRWRAAAAATMAETKERR